MALLWPDAVRRARCEAVRRRAASLLTTSTDSEEEGDPEEHDEGDAGRVTLPWHAARVLEITFCGYKLTVLNCIRPKILKVDPDAATFITEYVSKQLGKGCDQQKNVEVATMAAFRCVLRDGLARGPSPSMTPGQSIHSNRSGSSSKNSSTTPSASLS